MNGKKMTLTSNDVTFLTKSSRKSKSDKMYYLYTFMCGEYIYPTIYSDKDFEVVSGNKYYISLEVSNYNNTWNFRLDDISGVDNE